MAYSVYYVPAGDVLPHMFDSFDGATGASITMTGITVAKVKVYKDGGVTEREGGDAGLVLLDTDGIDFDGITGIHGFSIDTGDNTDAGFYAVGSWFHVVVDTITVDAQTVSFVACAFRIMASETIAGVPETDVTHWLGTAAATPTVAGVPEVDVTHWLGTAAATPSVAGVPEVDLTHVAGVTTNVSALATNVDAILTDTNELQTDWVDGGRLDLIIDDILTDTGTTIDDLVDDLESRLGTPSDLGSGATVSANLVDIESQTDDIGAAGAGLTAINLPDQVMNITGDITGNLSGSVGSVTGAVGSVTGNVGGNVVGSVASVTGAVGSVSGSVGSLVGHTVQTADHTASVASILSLLDDARTEPAQGAPPLNPDMATKIDWLYKSFRNRKSQTATQWSLFNDDESTVDSKAVVSDDGTTAIKQEIVSGP